MKYSVLSRHNPVRVLCFSDRRWGLFMIMGLICLLSGSATSLSARAEEPVEIVTFEYPPIMTATLPNDGLLGEIVHAAFQAVGQEVTISYTSPKRVLMMYVGTQESGGFLAPINLVKRQKAEENVICVNPLVNILMVFYYYKPNHDTQKLQYETLEELTQYRVGAITGSNTIELLTNAGITVYESSVDAQIQMLQKGRADLAIIGLLTGKQLVERYFPDTITDFAFIEKPLMELPTGICFNTQHPSGQAWAEMFVQGFTEIYRQGIYTDILERYYGKNQIPQQYTPLLRALEEKILVDLKQVPEL